jgi:chromosome segregation ATPase
MEIITAIIGLLGAGGLGAVLLKVVEKWLAKPEARQSREDAISQANDRLAKDLRDEMRLEMARRDADNRAEIARRDAEIQVLRLDLAHTKGEVSQLTTTNRDQRKENLALTSLNAAQSVKLAAQAEQLAVQADRITTQEEKIKHLQQEVDTLRADMARQAAAA